MLLSPRYSGPTVVNDRGGSARRRGPLVRQRARLAEIAATFTDAEWSAPSRCAAWSVRDVIAHLAGINPLYVMSAVAGLAGAPTRLMPHFDPAVSPLRMVDDIGSLSSAEVLDLFISSNAELVALVETLDDVGWSCSAESPLGEVSVRLLMSHALWDSWVHERDILIPLGIEPAVIADEVVASLRYVSALTQGFAFGIGMECRGRFGIEATDPDFYCVMAVEDAVRRAHRAPGRQHAGASRIRGGADRGAQHTTTSAAPTRRRNGTGFSAGLSTHGTSSTVRRR